MSEAKSAEIAETEGTEKTEGTEETEGTDGQTGGVDLTTGSIGTGGDAPMIILASMNPDDGVTRETPVDIMTHVNDDDSMEMGTESESKGSEGEKHGRGVCDRCYKTGAGCVRLGRELVSCVDEELLQGVSCEQVCPRAMMITEKCKVRKKPIGRA